MSPQLLLSVATACSPRLGQDFAESPFCFVTQSQLRPAFFKVATFNQLRRPGVELHSPSRRSSLLWQHLRPPRKALLHYLHLSKVLRFYVNLFWLIFLFQIRSWMRILCCLWGPPHQNKSDFPHFPNSFDFGSPTKFYIAKVRKIQFWLSNKSNHQSPCVNYAFVNIA
jgi:hypothetical protein